VRKLSNLVRNYVRPFRRARDRKGIATVAGEVWTAYRTYGVFPEHYFRLALYLEGIEGEVRDFLPKAVLYPVQQALNGSRFPPVVSDKALFGRTMRSHGIPSVAELFTVEADGELRDTDGAPIDAAEAEARIRAVGGKAFVKPASGLGGQGTRIFEPGLDRMEDLLARGERCLVQPVIVQHPVLAELYPGSVNTVRIDTLLDNGECHHNGAVLRLGLGGNIVDNAGQGGLVVPIDPETGALRPLGRRKPYFSTEFYTRHPDTGVVFSAVTVPFWPEVLAIVRRGAEALQPLRSLGWDIAVTAEGPVVIEANAFWGAEHFQLGRGLRHTPIGQMVLERLRMDGGGKEGFARSSVTPADPPAARGDAAPPGR
jgi:hypothetical protein